ncbi:MAG: sigma-70 family RNA polymerase sigma factor [Rubricoccaceae bacterium]
MPGDARTRSDGLPLGGDTDLIDAFRRGDEFAFVALYDRHKGPVYAYCVKMLLDREAAQDVLQETFARAYENRERLLKTTAFKAWLFTIARNQCLNALRRSGREVPFAVDAPEPPGNGVTPFAALLKSEQADLISRMLAELSPEYREVIVLREYQNLSYDEIAAVTRSTVSAVKSRLFKARRKLGAALRPWLRPNEAEVGVAANLPAL